MNIKTKYPLRGDYFGELSWTHATSFQRLNNVHNVETTSCVNVFVMWDTILYIMIIVKGVTVRLLWKGELGIETQTQGYKTE